MILCYIAIAVLFISSWGSVLAFSLGKLQLTFFGLLLFIGTLALTYLVSVIEWVVEEIRAHSKKDIKKHLKIMSTANEMDRLVMEQNFSTKDWYVPFVYAFAVTFYIMMFSVVGVFYLIAWLFNQLRDCIYAKAT